MSKSAKPSHDPNTALNKKPERPVVDGGIKKSTKKKQDLVSKDKPSKPTSKTDKSKHNKDVVGTCELRSNIYNHDQVRGDIYHKKLESKQQFYVNHPIPPAPTRNSTAVYMREYSKKLIGANSYPHDLEKFDPRAEDQVEKIAQLTSSTDASLLGPMSRAQRLQKKSEGGESAGEDESDDGSGDHINVSQSASVRMIHAIDTALGGIFDFVHGVYGKPKKLTAAMLMGAFKAQLHYHHIHPRHKGNLELLFKACSVLVEMKNSKESIVKAKGREFYDDFQASIYEIFKNEFKQDINRSPLFRGEGMEGAYLRYKITSAEKSCGYILELFVRLMTAEAVHYSIELATQNSMVTITDQICARALTVLGFQSL
jgi:hypothetical protein